MLVYVSLGLLEVDDFERNIRRLRNADLSEALINGALRRPQKDPFLLLVRTQMSAITGLLVFGILTP